MLPSALSPARNAAVLHCESWWSPLQPHCHWAQGHSAGYGPAGRQGQAPCWAWAQLHLKTACTDMAETLGMKPWNSVKLFTQGYIAIHAGGMDCLSLMWGEQILLKSSSWDGSEYKISVCYKLLLLGHTWILAICSNQEAISSRHRRS